MPALLMQTVSFVHPALAGLAAAMGLVPIALHLISRKRHRPVTWAAMSFLLAARGRSRRRVWLENWLLMLLRVALIVLLGLAVARPYVPSSTFSPLRATHVHRILVVDNSLSMGAVDEDGRTRFSRARDYADGLLRSFAESDPVSIVSVAKPASAPLPRPAYDRRLVRDALAGIEPTQRSADMAGALGKVIDILAASRTALGNRVVYVISDFPRHVWMGESDPRAGDAAHAPGATVLMARRLADALADPGVDLNFIRVASGPVENVSVSDLALDSTLVATGTPLRLAATVTNSGALTARDLLLEVRRDDQIIRRDPLATIEPGESKMTTVSVQFAAPGTHTLEARVISATPDSLADDDARYLSVEVADAIPVLIIDGQPGATPLAGEAGYLATALAPRASGLDRGGAPGSFASRSGGMLIQPKVITLPELEGEILADYDVLALCNVGRLSAAQWHYMESFAERGGGLLVFAGDLVSRDNYNRLGYADGKGLLPVEFAAASDADGADGRYLSFKLDSPNHPITAEFAEYAGSGLFLARVDRHLSAVVDPGRAEVVLRYTDDEPALVASKFGRGRVVLCTTTANMDWTNLPAKGDYVSLVLNTVAYLSPRRGEHRNVEVGRSVMEPLTPMQSSLPMWVTTRSGTEEGRLVSLSDRLALEFGPVRVAGVFSMNLGSTVRKFAANVDPAESALAAADESAIREALDRPITFTDGLVPAVAQSAPGRSTELASVALWAVLAFLFVEMWLAMWLGSHRTRPAASAPMDQRRKAP